MKKALSTRENEIFALLREGKTYAEIQRLLSITPANLHTLACRIRKKTGTPATGRTVAPLNRYSFPPQPRDASSPTPGQLRIMEMTAQGRAMGSIANALKISPQTVANALTAGCRRAGIANQGHRRAVAIRAYLDVLNGKPDPMADPMFQ